LKPSCWLRWPTVRSATRSGEHGNRACLALAEPDRLVLPFVTTGAQELLESLPRHATAHAALLADILDVVHGASLTGNNQSPSPQTEELSPSELRVLRYLHQPLPTEIASQLSVSVNTVNTHIRSISPSFRPPTAHPQCSAHENCGCSRPAAR
jgi:LuxR family maltose regulon positive regulatory protein